MQTRSILDLIDDPQAFAPWFKDPTTWAAWRAFLAALFTVLLAFTHYSIERDPALPQILH